MLPFSVWQKVDEEEDSEHVWQGFSSYSDINGWQGQANPELLESEEEEQRFELVNGAEDENLTFVKQQNTTQKKVG